MPTAAGHCEPEGLLARASSGLWGEWGQAGPEAAHVPVREEEAAEEGPTEERQPVPCSGPAECQLPWVRHGRSSCWTRGDGLSVQGGD